MALEVDYYLLPTSKSRDNNGDKNQKPGPISFRFFRANLRICVYLPATVVNVEEIAFENGPISDFQGLVTLNLPWIGSYSIPSCITRRSLPRYWMSSKWKKLVWTFGRADGHLRPTLLGRLVGVDLKCSSWLSVRVTYELSRSRLLTLVLQLARTIIGQGHGHSVAYIRRTFDSVARCQCFDKYNITAEARDVKKLLFNNMLDQVKWRHVDLRPIVVSKN